MLTNRIEERNMINKQAPSINKREGSNSDKQECPDLVESSDEDDQLLLLVKITISMAVIKL